MFAIETVRDVAGEKKQDNAGKELRQPGQAQVERPVRNVVNLPADGNRLHLGAKDDAKSRNLVEAESGELKRRGPRGFGVVAGGHASLVCHILGFLPGYYLRQLHKAPAPL